MTHTFDFNDDLTLDTGEFMAFDDIENDIDDDDMNFLHDDDFMHFEEGDAMFYPLFTQFTQQVSQFFQDKRVSEVIRPDGRTGTYGSQAVVRRSGLDLRHNLKQVFYGHIAILKTEVMGLLNAAFEILDSPDIRHLFGSNSAWDTLEEVMKRHLSETPIISQRGRMAVTGRDILR
jgi:hypothetical protein